MTHTRFARTKSSNTDRDQLGHRSDVPLPSVSAAVLRFPSPIRSKSRTVPTDYGLRSDDCKGTIHLGKQSADASQYQPVNRNKSKPLRIRASQHIDLLP